MDLKNSKTALIIFLCSLATIIILLALIIPNNIISFVINMNLVIILVLCSIFFEKPRIVGESNNILSKTINNYKIGLSILFSSLIIPNTMFAFHELFSLSLILLSYGLICSLPIIFYLIMIHKATKKIEETTNIEKYSHNFGILMFLWSFIVPIIFSSYSVSLTFFSFSILFSSAGIILIIIAFFKRYYPRRN